MNTFTSWTLLSGLCVLLAVVSWFFTAAPSRYILILLFSILTILALWRAAQSRGLR